MINFRVKHLPHSVKWEMLKIAQDQTFLFNQFKAYLMVQRGVSEAWAKSCINAVKRFIGQTGIKNPQPTDTIHYLTQFHQKQKSYSHIVNTSLALERYAEFLGQPFKLGRPKKPKRLITQTLSETEIARMLKFCHLRQKAILALLAYTGIRNAELCRLKVKDIDFADQTILIKNGKGAKDGLVCIAPKCLELIKQYLGQYPRRSDQTLFFTAAPNGKGQLNPAAVRKQIKKIAQKTHIKKRVYPHLLRHSLAINILLRGGDLWTIKNQLRHSQIETTLIYVRSDTRTMKNRYRLFCPNYL